MDLDTDSLQLILALAKTEETTHLVDENPELGKHRQRVIDLVTEMKNRGHAKLIKIEKITVSSFHFRLISWISYFLFVHICVIRKLYFILGLRVGARDFIIFNVKTGRRMGEA